MSAEKPPAFIDTNILVYAFEKTGSAKKKAAEGLLNHLMDEDRLRLSTQILQELFVTLTRKGTQPCSTDEAVRVLDDLAAWPVLVVDCTAIRAAAGLSAKARVSFWDALVVVAAAGSGAEILYTEDLNHGQEILGVRVVNPFLNA